MQLPDYWLPRPSSTLTKEASQAFDELLASVRNASACSNLEYALPFPKWQFLCYAAERHPIALHGSGNPNIAEFEPRQSNDLSEFGNQNAVYAASDGIWAMFFAIVDRDRLPMSVTNACVRLVDPEGNIAGPFYYFSVSRSVLPNAPWRTGMVYLMPRVSFMTQPPLALENIKVEIAQLASLVPVTPFARLTVTPHDFPFLAQIRGHDDARLQEYATALQTGAPLPED